MEQKKKRRNKEDHTSSSDRTDDRNIRGTGNNETTTNNDVPTTMREERTVLNDKYRHSRATSYADGLRELIRQRKEQDELRREVNEQSERIGTLIAAQKKLFKVKEKLVDIEDPVLILTRTSGEIEIYHKVRGDEFLVPGLPEGIEKKLYLGQQWQHKIPYAGRTFRMYWAHEDWTFPHVWSKPNIYQGALPKKIRDWISDPSEVTTYPEGIPMILENANVNSEAQRDKERKILIAWEKLKAGAAGQRLAAWAKIILYICLGVAAILFVMNFFGKEDPATAVQAAGTIAQNVSNVATGGIILS